MAFLLRVELPDVPGSLGILATALGQAGADIEAIEIVEHRRDGKALDDVVLELPSHVLPDEIVSACHQLDGVQVHWISRYNAGANLSMDLEVIESFTTDPRHAIQRLVEELPMTLRVDWSMALQPAGASTAVLAHSGEAPEPPAEAAAWLAVNDACEMPPVSEWNETLVAVAPGKDVAGRPFVIAVGRYGGPPYLASEIARLGLITTLAATVQSD